MPLLHLPGRLSLDLGLVLGGILAASFPLRCRFASLDIPFLLGTPLSDFGVRLVVFRRCLFCFRVGAPVRKGNVLVLLFLLPVFFYSHYLSYGSRLL